METMSYDDICRIVGDLYINSRKMLQKQSGNAQLALELQEARQKITSLEAELERAKFFGKQDT